MAIIKFHFINCNLFVFLGNHMHDTVMFCDQVQFVMALTNLYFHHLTAVKFNPKFDMHNNMYYYYICTGIYTYMGYF
jgi:hypothetical protein